MKRYGRPESGQKMLGWNSPISEKMPELEDDSDNEDDSDHFVEKAQGNKVKQLPDLDSGLYQA
jgi:hypothetical protein